MITLTPARRAASSKAGWAAEGPPVGDKVALAAYNKRAASRAVKYRFRTIPSDTQIHIGKIK